MHNVFPEEINKIALSYDEKRMQSVDSIETYGYMHIIKRYKNGIKQKHKRTYPNWP